MQKKKMPGNKRAYLPINGHFCEKTFFLTSKTLFFWQKKGCFFTKKARIFTKKASKTIRDEKNVINNGRNEPNKETFISSFYSLFNCFL